MVILSASNPVQTPNAQNKARKMQSEKLATNEKLIFGKMKTKPGIIKTGPPPHPGARNPHPPGYLCSSNNTKAR